MVTLSGSELMDSLQFSNVKRLRQLCLDNLPGLNDLTIKAVEQLRDLDTLQSLTGLKTLELRNPMTIESLTWPSVPLRRCISTRR